MPITTYIVDDENQARKRLVYLIDHFFSNEIDIIGQSDNPHEALGQITEQSPELLFLDVEMPNMTGLELSEKLTANGYKGKIIFVTAFNHYSVKAIRANAFDYLVKPVDVEELKQAISRFTSSNEHLFNKGIIKNFDLSNREVELITHLSFGLSSEEIADKMFLSKHTVDTHRRNIHTKTGTRNAIELINLLRN